MIQTVVACDFIIAKLEFPHKYNSKLQNMIKAFFVQCVVTYKWHTNILVFIFNMGLQCDTFVFILTDVILVVGMVVQSVAYYL